MVVVPKKSGKIHIHVNLKLHVLKVDKTLAQLKFFKAGMPLVGFWQIILSQYPHILIRRDSFKKLPFRISSASEHLIPMQDE